MFISVKDLEDQLLRPGQSPILTDGSVKDSGVSTSAREALTNLNNVFIVQNIMIIFFSKQTRASNV